MQHQEWQDLIPFYVAKTLSDEELRQFEAHLAGCETCQAEIEDWRTIASAIWREAETAARSLPPLSPDVYQRLNARERQQQSQRAAQINQENAPANVRQLRQPTRGAVPLTLVAGIVVAVFFGGLLLFLALGQSQQGMNDGDTIVLNMTVIPVTDGAAAAGIGGDGVISTVTPRPTDLGIIPPLPVEEQDATENVVVFATNTSLPPVENPLALNVPLTEAADIAAMTDNTDETAAQSAAGSSEFNATVFPTPVQPVPTRTPDILQVAPLGSGPHITPSPGAATCMAFNPTNVPLELYARADRNSQIVNTLVPGDMMQVVGRSNTGWYLVENVSGMRSWLQVSFAYLIGNCDVNIPVATIQPTATRLSPSVTPQVNIETPVTDRVVVVSAAFADLYSGPTFDSTVIGVVERNQEFPVTGYQGTGTNRWVRIRLTDDSSAWLWASIVTEYEAGQAP